MFPIGSHIQRLISSCDEGVYMCTRLRNRAKAGRDMRNKGNFSLKILLRNMKIKFNRCEGHENNTLCRTVTALSVTFFIKQALNLLWQRGWWFRRRDIRSIRMVARYYPSSISRMYGPASSSRRMTCLLSLRVRRGWPNMLPRET